MTQIRITTLRNDMYTLDTFRKSLHLDYSQLYCNDISPRVTPTYVRLFPCAIDAAVPGTWASLRCSLWMNGASIALGRKNICWNLLDVDYLAQRISRSDSILLLGSLDR